MIKEIFYNVFKIFHALNIYFVLKKITYETIKDQFSWIDTETQN